MDNAQRKRKKKKLAASKDGEKKLNHRLRLKPKTRNIGRLLAARRRFLAGLLRLLPERCFGEAKG